MVVFLVSAQERRVGSWWTWCAWRTVSSLSIGTSFRTKPRESPRKAGFRCSETSSLTNEQTAPSRSTREKGCRRAVPQEPGKQGLHGSQAGLAPASRARKTEHNTLCLWRLRYLVGKVLACL